MFYALSLHKSQVRSDCAAGTLSLYQAHVHLQFGCPFLGNKTPHPIYLRQLMNQNITFNKAPDIIRRTLRASRKGDRL